ncbi:MAG TPA: T9SS type A sorting domain-containing protein [Bacteroidia bacterium]|nr:T9SS type A sorting domain-containing protein [Bacteroidia bacterium]
MNKKFNLIVLLCLVLFSFKAKAQIENVMVETYYVSDTNDATDTIGGILEPGSKTYRVFIDLAPGCKLKKIFGNGSHTLRFSSTGMFWNNLDRGKSFGWENNISYLDEGTVALDTYITLGQATKNNTTLTYFGILKTQDPDTSIIGGVHNDGGWSVIPDGLIANQDSAAGIPVTLKDGLVAVSNYPTNQQQDGILDAFTQEDSTIFGSLKVDSQFVSNSASVQCSGAMDAISGSNKVLVAQLTTKGEISFELNVEIEDINGNPIIYVANSDSLTGDTIASPYLNYPPSCGCTDPDYVEYSNTYACNNQSECKTLIVYGCMDQAACNFDPNANFNIPTLCCYPGYCNDRDLAVVCPSLNNERIRAAGSRLYPNPAQDELTLEIPQGLEAGIQYEIHDAYGNRVLNKNLGVVSSAVFEKIDVNTLSPGLYLVRLDVGSSFYIKKFMKN